MLEAHESPAYLSLHRNGDLLRRAGRATERLRICGLCPRNCGADRTAGQLGACGIGERAIVASWGPHHGEEAPLSGMAGSGTVFFSGCNLACIYCQNSDISHGRIGREVESGELAEIFIRLQKAGCHNINLVSPSHVTAQILAALVTAVEQGLNLPLVYNSGGYDSIDTLLLLDGVIDIYMPDMKYGNGTGGRQPGADNAGDCTSLDPLLLSGVPDYAEVNRAAVREMHRQVGDLVLDERGIARRGLLIRHLVLPGNAAHTEDVLRFLASQISQRTYLNLMDQYRPWYRASEFPPLNRRPTEEEFHSALEAARRLGLL